MVQRANHFHCNKRQPVRVHCSNCNLVAPLGHSELNFPICHSGISGIFPIQLIGQNAWLDSPQIDQRNGRKLREPASGSEYILFFLKKKYKKNAKYLNKKFFQTYMIHLVRYSVISS